MGGVSARLRRHLCRRRRRYAVTTTSADADAVTTTSADAGAVTAYADADAVTAYADADAVDDDDDAAAEDAEDAEDADDVQLSSSNFHGSHTMREGLLLVQIPGRYWSVTRVGWARRVEGDEWELLGATTVMRTGLPVLLDVLAAQGPEGHTCSAPSKLPELLHRWSPRRVLVADENAWAEACPKPEG